MRKFEAIESVLEVLRELGVEPADQDCPIAEIGEITGDEGFYEVTLDDVFSGQTGESVRDSDRDAEAELREALRNGSRQRASMRERHELRGQAQRCAWYCPVHYFAHGAGIYIRERCMREIALDIAAFTSLPSALIPGSGHLWNDLQRAAFYALFLHEQFHHKIESFGFRLLVSTQMDCYLRYKENVYQPTFLEASCLEESLANADAYLRLSETRYLACLHPGVRNGLRKYLRASFELQPPGYREASHYLVDSKFREGLWNLQTLVRDGWRGTPKSPSQWRIAPKMTSSLWDISKDMYLIVPRGGRPFVGRHLFPFPTVSSRGLIQALQKYYGYIIVNGGKGSHIKLKKPGSPTIILPANRASLSPGVVRHALCALGDIKLEKLPQVLNGSLGAAGVG